MRPSALTGFSIFTSLMQDRDSFVSRKPGVKVCDALFEWEKATKEATVGLLDGSLVPIFNFQRRLYWRCTVLVFQQDFALEDAIGSHAFLSEVHCPYRCHHKSCLNTEGTEMDGDKGAEDVLSVYQIAHCVNNGSFHVTLEDVR
jgi:hypothetical protein